MSKIQTVFSAITVEPYMFLFTAGIQIFSILGTNALLEKICLQNFASMPDVDCRNLTGTPKYSAEVQKQAGKWIMLITLANILPTVLLGPLYGAYADKRGRKTNLLIGISGPILLCLFYTAEFTWVMEMPIIILPPVALLLSLTGFYSVVYPASNSYIADRVHDRHQLTIRLTILSVVSGLAGVIADTVMGFSLLSFLSWPYVSLLPIIVWTLAFFYAILFLRQVPPAELVKIDKMNIVHETTKVDEIPAEPNPTIQNVDPKAKPLTCFQLLREGLSILKQLCRETIQTLSKRREGRSRAYLWCITFVLLFIVAQETGFFTVLNLFCLYKLHWSTQDVVIYRAVTSLLQLAAGLVAIVILKRFKFHETTIALLSMTSLVAKLLIVAFSSSKAMMYGASVVGCISGIGGTCMFSMGRQLVAPDEVGKLYGLFNVAVDGGVILAITVFNIVYRATIEWFAGFVFIFIAFWIVVSALLLMWVHVDFKRYRAKIAHS